VGEVDGYDVETELELLRSRVADLENALHSRSGIDQAIGMVMLARRIDADAAWDILSKLSQDTNIKVRDLAAAMVGLVSGGSTGVETTVLREAALRALLPRRPH
jgi:hypothetical protein